MAVCLFIPDDHPVSDLRWEIKRGQELKAEDACCVHGSRLVGFYTRS